MIDEKSGCYFYLMSANDIKMNIHSMIKLCSDEINFLYLRAFREHLNKSTYANYVNEKYVDSIDKIGEVIKENEFNLNSIIVEFDKDTISSTELFKIIEELMPFRKKYPIHLFILSNRIDQFITSDAFPKISMSLKVTDIYKVKDKIIKISGDEEEIITYESFKLGELHTN
jgi:predicted metalloenzyme YecM